MKQKCESCIHFGVCIFRRTLSDVMTNGPLNPYGIKLDDDEVSKVFNKVYDIVLSDCMHFVDKEILNK